MVPTDGGPVYCETDLTGFPVEPLNTFSNLLFLVVAIVWYRRLKDLNPSPFKNFVKLCLPLLLLGYVGGSLYHATRSHWIWLLLDVGPIYAIAILTAVYHWRLIEVSGVRLLLGLLVFPVIPLTALWLIVPASPLKPTLGYAMLVLPALAPIVLDLVSHRLRLLKEFLVPSTAIILALLFRSVDSSQWVAIHFPWGTHWIWHSLGALTCHWTLLYMHRRSLL